MSFTILVIILISAKCTIFNKKFGIVMKVYKFFLTNFTFKTKKDRYPPEYLSFLFYFFFFFLGLSTFGTAYMGFRGFERLLKTM